MLIPQNKKEQIQEIANNWFVFKKFYGTSEEKKLVDLISAMFDDICKKHQDIYLIRNERHFALYDFKQGRRFEPDFVLLSKREECNYQFFIEPKGKHLQPIDQWKKDFLLEIEQNYKAKAPKGSNNAITYSNDEYKIIGLEFYNSSDENKFKESLKTKLGI